MTAVSSVFFPTHNGGLVSRDHIVIVQPEQFQSRVGWLLPVVVAGVAGNAAQISVTRYIGPFDTAAGVAEFRDRYFAPIPLTVET